MPTADIFEETQEGNFLMTEINPLKIGLSKRDDVSSALNLFQENTLKLMKEENRLGVKMFGFYNWLYY